MIHEADAVACALLYLGLRGQAFLVGRFVEHFIEGSAGALARHEPALKAKGACDCSTSSANTRRGALTRLEGQHNCNNQASHLDLPLVAKLEDKPHVRLRILRKLLGDRHSGLGDEVGDCRLVVKEYS